MKDERIWQLVSLKLSGEASPEELTELDSLIKSNPNIGFQIILLEQVWKSKNETDADTDQAFNKHLQRLSNHFASPTLQYEQLEYEQKKSEKVTPVHIKTNYSFKNKIIFFSAIAASLIIILSLITIYTFPDSSGAISQNIVATKPGSKSKIILPDGSQVWLNSESKLTYDKKFGENTREVSLTGEAFFDVVKDAARPFIIHTNTIDVKVLGTAFNVRSYPNEKTVETSLIRGLVEVTLINNADKKIILKPNEKLVVQNTSQKMPVNSTASAIKERTPLLIISNLHYIKGDSSAVETSWIKNKLAFESETLEDVARKIERWYGVKIIIKDENLKEAEFTGVFEDEGLEEVLEALKLTGDFNYSIARKEVLITQN
ncbi:MAG TPA: FecR family protein [Segetibacter sp.]|jgi:ferric-dicitrate binding protein FerR (iron transport regulator)